MSFLKRMRQDFTEPFGFLDNLFSVCRLLVLIIFICLVFTGLIVGYMSFAFPSYPASQITAENTARRFVGQLYPNKQVNAVCMNANTMNLQRRVRCYTTVEGRPGPTIYCSPVIDPARNTGCE